MTKDSAVPAGPPLTDEEFKNYLMELIKVVAKENVNGHDQIEAMIITLCSVSIAIGASPSELLMFFAQRVVGMTAKITELGNSMKKTAPQSEPSDLKNLLSKIKRDDFKN